MPVTALGMNVVLTWASAVPTPFGARKQGPSSLSFNLAGLSLTTFNQVYSGNTTVGAGSFVDIDTSNLTNENAETINFTRLEMVAVKPSGANIQLTTASSNPILWFFVNGSSSIPVNNHAVFAYSNSDGTDTAGYATSGSHKTFRISNVGSGAATVSVAIGGGTN